jgi:hypothetical protein
MSDRTSAGISASTSSDEPRAIVEMDSLVDHLHPDQIAALAALGSGRTIREAADAAGVERHTVTRWITGDPNFRAAYNIWRRELIESIRAKLLKTAEAAAAAVDKAVEKGDARIAMALLTKLALASPATTELTDPALVREQIDLERRIDEKRVENARSGLCISYVGRELIR